MTIHDYDLDYHLDSLKKAVILSKKSKFHRLLGARFLVSLLLENITARFSHPIEVNVSTFWGAKMTVVIPEAVSTVISRYGFYEEGLSNIFLHYLKPGMTFFDVGAHFGYFSLLGSALVGERGQVHSFEPTPSTFNILKKNTIGKQNITVNHNALFSKNTHMLLNDYGIIHSAFNSIYMNTKLSTNCSRNMQITEHHIKAISIDEYATINAVVPDFIKIDAESSEYNILIGGKKMIEQYHPFITMEVGDTEIEGIPKSREIIEYLMSRKYVPYNYIDGEINPHCLKSESYKYDNILFVPLG